MELLRGIYIPSLHSITQYLERKKSIENINIAIGIFKLKVSIMQLVVPDLHTTAHTSSITSFTILKSRRGRTAWLAFRPESYPEVDANYRP